MKRTALSIVGALLLFGVTPAFAKEDCNAGYKDFLGKMSTHISKMSGDELASYIRKSLGAYDSACLATTSRRTACGIRS